MPLKTEKTQNSEKFRKSESVKAYVGETNLTESFTTVTQLLAEAEVEVAKALQVAEECRTLLPQGVWKCKRAFNQTGEFITIST